MVRIGQLGESGFEGLDAGALRYVARSQHREDGLLFCGADIDMSDRYARGDHPAPVGGAAVSLRGGSERPTCTPWSQQKAHLTKW